MCWFVMGFVIPGSSDDGYKLIRVVAEMCCLPVVSSNLLYSVLYLFCLACNVCIDTSAGRETDI